MSKPAEAVPALYCRGCERFWALVSFVVMPNDAKKCGTCDKVREVIPCTAQ